MKLYNEKEYFLNEDKDIVEIEKYVSGEEPYGNYSYGWGDNHRFSPWKEVAKKIDSETEDKIKEKISEYLDTKYEIKLDPELEPGEYDRFGIDLIDKETGEVEDSFASDYDKQDIFDEVIAYSFTIDGGYLDFDYIINDLEIDISDVFNYRELRSNVEYDSFAIVYMTDEDFKEEFGVNDVSELTQEQKDAALDAYASVVQSHLDYEEYAYTTYNLQGEEINTCCGFFGDDTELNGIEDYTGNLVESLGEYDSIEDCFEANQEKLGIVLAPLPSLEERITLAEDKAASQSSNVKEVKGKDDLEY